MTLLFCGMLKSKFIKNSKICAGQTGLWIVECARLNSTGHQLFLKVPVPVAGFW